MKLRIAGKSAPNVVERSSQAPRESSAAIVAQEYLSPEELARWLGVAPRTLARWYAHRIGPPRITVGKTILYRRKSIEDWLASKEVPTTV